MRTLFTFLSLFLFCLNLKAQVKASGWLKDEKRKGELNFEQINKYLGVSDIEDSPNIIEVRLYLTSGNANAVTCLTYNDKLFDGYYFSKGKRTMDDPVATVFPMKKYHISEKKLDSVFMALTSHNIFNLPDQAETNEPVYIRVWTIQFKVNNKIRNYSFSDPWFVKKGYPEEFQEYKAISETFRDLYTPFLASEKP